MKATLQQHEFIEAFRGRFTGIIEWKQLDDFWSTVNKQAGKGWYIHAVGEPVPTESNSAGETRKFVAEIDALLRKEHQEDYCGIVYTDDTTDPHFIKIFDPNNLGVVCGYSDNPPLPGWIMSTIAPVDLHDTSILPGNRRRWWQKIWKKAG